MLYGVGCDLCASARIEKILAGPHGAAFARRVFGPQEHALLFPAEPPASPRAAAHRADRAAANFAAKEAFLKAAGTGLAGPFSLCEIEAVRLESGAPVYHFSGRTAQWMAEQNLTARLSLSHETGMALAFCVLERAGL